jgi:hypothetical protein
MPHTLSERLLPVVLAQAMKISSNLAPNVLNPPLRGQRRGKLAIFTSH